MSTLILIIQVSGILLEPFFHLSFKRCFFFFFFIKESHILKFHIIFRLLSKHSVSSEVLWMGHCFLEETTRIST